MGRREAWQRLVFERPAELGVATGFNKLKPLHNDWLRGFLFNREDQTLQAHRGSFKSTVLSIALPILMILDPTKAILFLRKTDPDVAEMMRRISALLQTDVFRELSLAFNPTPLVVARESQHELTTSLALGVKGVSQLQGLGIGSSITGKHADIVVTDDIVNIKDKISRAERERTKLMVMELENIKNPGGRFISTGTPWHKEDAFSLMKNLQRYDWKSTGLLTKEDVAELRQKMTAQLFAANYELRHIAGDDQLFDNPIYADAEASMAGSIGHIDAAYGGADSTAFTIAKRTSNGYLILGKLWSGHVDDCVNQILDLAKAHKVGTIHCEKNADKGYLKKELSREWPAVKAYSESTNKYIKISTHGKGNWANIRFHADTDDEYLSEILDYSEHAAHDDAPDSMASAIRELSKPRTEVRTFAGGI